MISYELAKQLKDNGFPIEDRRCSNCRELDFSSCSVCDDFMEQRPNLSELIEECRKWRPEFRLHFYPHGCVIELSKTESDMELQPTPEEAVARLYLELNKK